MSTDDSSRSSGAGPGSVGLGPSLEGYSEGGEALLSAVRFHTKLPWSRTGIHHTCESDTCVILKHRAYLCLSLFLPYLLIQVVAFSESVYSSFCLSVELSWIRHHKAVRSQVDVRVSGVAPAETKRTGEFPHHRIA